VAAPRRPNTRDAPVLLHAPWMGSWKHAVPSAWGRAPPLSPATARRAEGSCAVVVKNRRKPSFSETVFTGPSYCTLSHSVFDQGLQKLDQDRGKKSGPNPSTTPSSRGAFRAAGVWLTASASSRCAPPAGDRLRCTGREGHASCFVRRLRLFSRTVPRMRGDRSHASRGRQCRARARAGTERDRPRNGLRRAAISAHAFVPARASCAASSRQPRQPALFVDFSVFVVISRVILASTHSDHENGLYPFTLGQSRQTDTE